MARFIIIKDIQSFIKFANFDWWFIKSFNKITILFILMLHIILLFLFFINKSNVITLNNNNIDNINNSNGKKSKFF